jgi:hypothetical protein
MAGRYCRLEPQGFEHNTMNPAPFGEHWWRQGIVIGLGKNRGDRTVVHLSFETGGKSRRVAGELFWRKAELKGKDKPMHTMAEA